MNISAQITVDPYKHLYFLSPGYKHTIQSNIHMHKYGL